MDCAGFGAFEYDLRRLSIRSVNQNTLGADATEAPDQEIFQSTVSSKTPRGKYFSSHRPRHSKCFGRRLRRSVMVASVISTAVSWGVRLPIFPIFLGERAILDSSLFSLLVFSPRDLFYRVSRIQQTYLLGTPANVCFGSKADIQRPGHLCPLLGVKRTSKGNFGISQFECPLSGVKRTLCQTPQHVRL